LQFQVLLFLHKLRSLILKMLGSLFQSILSESRLCLAQSCVDLLQFVSGVIYFLRQHVVFFFKLFIFVPLLWIEIIKSSLILEIDVLDLLLIGMDL
jgi:hypothetical protein